MQFLLYTPSKFIPLFSLARSWTPSLDNVYDFQDDSFKHWIIDLHTTTFRSRACTSRDGKKKKRKKNEERRWIHRWPGFLGSWKVFSSAGECKHCCLLESSLVPGSRASSLVISPLFPPVFLRPAAAILLLLSFPSLSPHPTVLLRWKGQQPSVKESIFGRRSFTPMWNERICIVSIAINGEGCLFARL